MDDRKLKTTINLPESVMWLLRETAVRKRIASDGAAMEAAIRFWHENSANADLVKALPTSENEADTLKLSGPMRPLVRMLNAIFSSGKEDAIRAVRESIRVFYTYVSIGRPVDSDAESNTASPSASEGSGGTVSTRRAARSVR